MGFKNTKIPVNEDGLLNLSALSIEEQKKITFLSVMMANNETGVIQDMSKIIKWAKSHKVLIHTDAVQAVGKIEVDFERLDIDAMTISSHKIYGPQGAAALILNKKIDLYPFLMGGGQEKGLRSGTENIAAIVGFGKACERVQKNIVTINDEVSEYRDYLEKELKNLGAVIFSEQTKRLANTTFFAFKNIDGSTLLTALDRNGYAIASGSACSSNSSEASHVLLAMGIEPELAQGALRVSLGIRTSKDEIKSFLKALKKEIDRLKQLTAMAA
jgi:cysteine desulfurase